jgi:hypothetical protein
MALFTSASPDIQVKEVDLSGVVPGVATSTGAFVGRFVWGPANDPVLVSNEAVLTQTFGSPSVAGDSETVDYLSASSFLKYGSNLYVSRGIKTSDTFNARAAGSASTVENFDDWDTKKGGATITGNKILGKYPGAVGNSLKVSICPMSGVGVDVDDAAFDGWAYKSFFDAAPGLSSYVDARTSLADSSGDEVHAVVVDSDGLFSGTPGTVLETFAFASVCTDAKTDDGQSNYILDVLNDRSSYVWGADISTEFTGVSAAASFAGAGTNAVQEYALSNGANGSSLTPTEVGNAFDDYEDPDTIQVDFLIAPGMNTQDGQVTVVTDLVATAQNLRKDCVVVTSPSRADVVSQTPADAVTKSVAFANRLTASSYLIVDNNYLKVYDKYNDQYVYIPAASSTAGIMSATDLNAAPWFSPAGQRRGQYFGITSLAYNPIKSQRDTLYKAGVNPIVTLPGQGTILFGDKTKLGRPSAFDRINVRRLFLTIERAIKGAAQNVMFEFNDEFTRAELVNIIEPFLREIKGRRGITDFRVVADETNNTADVIDNNQFIASVFIKPARSINFVTLNFVAVRTGVSFDEVVGTV